MISGIFYVEFKANNNDFGMGLAVIDKGKLNGGDHSYLYRGRFDKYGDEVKAIVEVNHYRGELDSVMGQLKDYTLNLSGRISENTFDLSGGIPDVKGVIIRIVGKKVAEIFK